MIHSFQNDTVAIDILLLNHNRMDQLKNYLQKRENRAQKIMKRELSKPELSLTGKLRYRKISAT